MPTPTTDQLKAALAIAVQIQKLEEEYAAIMGGKAPAPAAPSPATTPPVPTIRGKRKGHSAETKAKMAAAAKRRWSRENGPKPVVGAKKKRVLSPEGRARIVAAVKARHAARKKMKRAARPFGA